MTKSIYIKCRVTRGFWDSEFYVVVGDTSLFVDRENVKVEKAPEVNAEVEGRVAAFLLRQDAEKALVELSGEPVVGGLRQWVPLQALANG